MDNTWLAPTCRWMNFMQDHHQTSRRKTSRHKISRRAFLRASTALAAAGAWRLPIGTANAADQKVQEIGTENQLFLDDWIVAENKGLRRVLHTPVKRGLIKEADGRDWERGDVYP